MLFSHKHWGIVDDNMKFHPNSTYFYASLEERRKLIFPSDWDLSEIEVLSGTGHRGAVEYNGGDLDRMYGPTWFLDNVAKATGLSDDLQKVFGGNAEMDQDILTLAYFLFLDSRTYSHIEKWQRIVKTPSVYTLTSSSITLLSQNSDLYGWARRFCPSKDSVRKIQKNQYLCGNWFVNGCRVFDKRVF